MTDGARHTVAPEGRRLVLRSLLLGGVAIVLLMIVARNCGSAGGVRSSGTGMVFTGVTNFNGSNYARFTITNPPGYLSFHFARVDAATVTGWQPVASNVHIQIGRFGGPALHLNTTNERVRFVFEVGTGSRPPFDWMRWFWRNNPRLEFLTNEVTLPPFPPAGER